MFKKLFFILSLILISALKSYAFEDCIITTKGKLTDIRIENNQVIDVYPIVTVENRKNTLVVHPLKEGITCFTVMKNYKEKFLFHVNVTEDKTLIKEVEGFNIQVLDKPPTKELRGFMPDKPPVFKGVE